MRNRIAYKLAAIWLAIAVPLVVVLAMSYVERHNSSLARIEQERIGYARLSAFAFRGLISDAQRTMTILGSEPVATSEASSQKTARFKKAASLYPAQYIVLLDVDGNVLAASDEDLIGTNLSAVQAFLIAPFAERGQAVEPSTQADDGGPSLHIAQLVRPPGTTSPCVMLMRIDIELLHEQYPLALGSGGVAIIDSWGQVVYQSEDATAAIAQQRWGDRYAFVRRALDGEPSATHEFRLGSGPGQTAAAVPIEPYGWAAVSWVDSEQSLASVWKSASLNLPVALGIAAVGFLVSVLMSMRIRRALIRLADDARIIGQGDFSKPVRVRRPDEIGDVATALDQARRRLLLYEHDNETLFARQQEVSDLNATLADIYAVIHSTLEFGDVLTVVLESSAQAIGSDAAGVNLRENGHWVRTALVGMPEQFVGERLTEKQNTIAAEIRRTRLPVIIQDAHNDPRIEDWFVERYGIESVMAFPLMRRGKVFGVLFYNHLTKGQRFTDAQIDFASKLSNSLSLAYENATLYAAEHNVAERLQGALLALPEHLDGVEFAVRYQAASDTARVGGDFYDLFALDQQVGITVGDVSGHGIDAAVVTSLVKTAVRVTTSGEGRTPAEALTIANNVLYRGSNAEIFATVLFAVLDPADGRVVYVNAGHTTGAIVSSTGVRLLSANSTIVGAFPDVEYVASEETLAQDELLILYTDGITEARGAEGLWGEARLISLLEDSAGMSPDDLADRVFGAVSAYAGGRFADDLAILVMRRSSD